MQVRHCWPLPVAELLVQLLAYVIIRQHTRAYVSIREHMRAYASTHEHTSAYLLLRSTCHLSRSPALFPASPPTPSPPPPAPLPLVPVYPTSTASTHVTSAKSRGRARRCSDTPSVSIRQRTPAYVSIRQHAAAYVSSARSVRINLAPPLP